MDFLRARSPAEIDKRQTEIINACDALYSKHGYEGVNFKAISALTSLSRPSIYNYFKTKDEVLLALLKRELLHWQTEFLEETAEIPDMSREQFSACLTAGLMRHAKMFRLLSILFSSLEESSRVESLADFYGSVAAVFASIFAQSTRYFPHATQEAKQRLQHEIVAYVLGLHAMTSLSDKRLSAMRLLGACESLPHFEPLCYHGILALLSALDCPQEEDGLL